MLDPLHLRTLTTVLQTGSFAVAARQLGYTPSAVSQQIAALERAVRLPVFERGARSVRPTPAAALLAVRGQEVLAALGVLQDDLRAFAEGPRDAVRSAASRRPAGTCCPGRWARWPPAIPPSRSSSTRVSPTSSRPGSEAATSTSRSSTATPGCRGGGRGRCR
jgi:DNA-binding transcriptional LysR family regulator